MIKPSKYNFKREANKNNSVYRLVMYPWEGSGIAGTYKDKRGDSVVVFYGYYNKSDMGLHMLRTLVQRYKGKIRLARIYAKPGLNPNHPQFTEIIETINH